MELKIQNISKSYDKLLALDCVSFALDNGVYGLLGPNGAGKTTLIKILIGVLDADKGKILIDNEPIDTTDKNYLKNIGYMPQYPQFYKNFKVEEFLRYMCALKGIKKDTDKKIDDVLSLVNLEDKKQSLIGSLSGGMRQRLGIAQAIINDPKILILDEPTAGLDPKERVRFRNIISRLSSDRIVIFATHIVSDIEMIAKEILILKKGRLILQGKPNELETNMNNKVWLVNTNYENAINLMDKYTIGNVKHIDDEYKIRIISDEKPMEGAINIEPSLEEVFLYLFT